MLSTDNYNSNVGTMPSQATGSSPPISSPATSGGSPPISSPPTKRFRGKRPPKWLIVGLIALIILLFGGSASFLIPWLPTVLSAATATVTITPLSQQMTNTYTIDAVTGTPDASQHQVQARLLSYTTPAQSKTVKATGKGHQEATAARGQLRITSVQGTIPAGTISLRGTDVAVVFYTATPITSDTTVDAHTAQAGSTGNIPAYYINHHYSNASFSFDAQNPQPFTGGQDASDSTFVQQSDIDNAAAPLVSQLTSDAQAAVQKQLGANEQFASTPECVPKISSNHQANDRVADVTVTVSVTCTAQAYEPQAVQSMAAVWFKSDTASQLGANYALAGDVITSSPQVQSSSAMDRISFSVNAQSVWVYQFSDTQKQKIAQLIAGKPLADAQALLQKQTGVKKVNVTTADGWGTALPTSLNDIKFIVVPVPGLQATATT